MEGVLKTGILKSGILIENEIGFKAGNSSGKLYSLFLNNYLIQKS